MQSFEFDVGDVEYLRHETGPLLARIYQPKGPGPFPAIVELHGGAWAQFERTRGKGLHESLARSGIVVAALDFRQAEVGAYPRGISDINYGIRWFKANADKFKTRPDLVGVSGNSSGGHLAMLVAMRPEDPRYASIPLADGLSPQNARVRCCVTFWPVIDPTARYEFARKLRDGPNPPSWPSKNMQHSLSFWTTEDNMNEGNPMQALVRGEKVVMPPAIWIQSSNDEVHDYPVATPNYSGTQATVFVEKYRAAGGSIELCYFDAPPLFTTEHPNMPQSVSAMNHVIGFIHENSGLRTG